MGRHRAIDGPSRDYTPETMSASLAATTQVGTVGGANVQAAAERAGARRGGRQPMDNRYGIESPSYWTKIAGNILKQGCLILEPRFGRYDRLSRCGALLNPGVISP